MREQINQLQSMMEQLITMVGSNNAAIEELRQDVGTLKHDVETLKQEMADLRHTTEKGFASIVLMVNILGDKTDGYTAN